MPRRDVAPRPWVPLLGFALAGCVALALASDKFLTSFNIYVILSGAALLAVVGFSQLVVLGVGQFSLAIGGIGSLVGVVVGYLLVRRDVPLAAAVTLGLMLGTLCGLLNGLLVAKSDVNGFIITLATGGGFAGAALGITKAQPYTDLPALMNSFGTGRAGFIPYLAGATVVVAVGLAVLYRSRRVGRLMLAVGGNAEGAALAGLSPTKAVVWAHSLSGLLAGLAGIMATAKLHEANPFSGADWLILSFTVAIIGGTSLAGGMVSIGGVLVAGLILGIITNGLVILNLNPYWVTLVQGLLVFLTVVIGRAAGWEWARALFERVGHRRRVPARPVGEQP